MFEQAFKNIDADLRNEAGCTTELDYTEQTSWLLKAGWQTKTLGELCEIELGKTPARANASFRDEKRETSNVWLSIADLLKATSGSFRYVCLPCLPSVKLSENSIICRPKRIASNPSTSKSSPPSTT